mmetsp:Transcript_13235/g.37096  ORF Transcript_13235/g.37096 Transcript_13235/m.37096 type:complete len:95 (-) Transcript_13235:595-879(-)
MSSKTCAEEITGHTDCHDNVYCTCSERSAELLIRLSGTDKSFLCRVPFNSTAPNLDISVRLDLPRLAKHSQSPALEYEDVPILIASAPQASPLR